MLYGKQKIYCWWILLSVLKTNVSSEKLRTVNHLTTMLFLLLLWQPQPNLVTCKMWVGFRGKITWTKFDLSARVHMGEAVRSFDQTTPIHIGDRWIRGSVKAARCLIILESLTHPSDIYSHPKTGVRESGIFLELVAAKPLKGVGVIEKSGGSGSLTAMTLAHTLPIIFSGRVWPSIAVVLLRTS